MVDTQDRHQLFSSQGASGISQLRNSVVFLSVVVIPVKQALRLLWFVAGFLLVIGWATQYYASMYRPEEFQTKECQGIIRLFFLDGEGNIPSWYQSVTLLLCSFLFFIIASKRKGTEFRMHWQVMALIFLFLSLDEEASFHEGVGNHFSVAFHTGGMLSSSFAWVVPGAVLTAAFVVSYWRFLNHLEREARTQFILAGAVYVSGTLVAEMVGGWITNHYGARNLLYLGETVVEEGLECAGIILFIGALLQFIQSDLNRERPRLDLRGQIQPTSKLRLEFFGED